MSSSYNIRGVPVSFPFEPYELQKQYMDKVIQCLQNSENGVLESPTGTGKTLSLLCSTLAWLAVQKAQIKESLLSSAYNDEISFNEDGSFTNDNSAFVDAMEHMASVPKIIYSSRTHSQLSQAMQELKRTAYADVRSTVLGGRDQLCIHPDVMQEKNNSVKGNLCGLKVKQKSCQFHNRADSNKMPASIKSIMDIEDLVVSGKRDRFCPYYMARNLYKLADIIFMPYNYLLDGKVRKSFGINLTNCVIIFDEAHNIEHICEESASAQIKRSDIVLGVDEAQSVMDLITGEKNSGYLNMDQLEKLNIMNIAMIINLKQTLMKFANVLNGIEIQDPAKGATFPGDHIYEIMRNCNITYDNNNSLMNVAETVIQFLSTLTTGPILHRGTGLSKLLDLLELVFAGSGRAFKPMEPEQQKTFIQKVNKCYKVHVNQMNKDGNPIRTHSSVSNVQKDKYDKVLNFWCFSPGFGMNILMEQKPKCIILTSGTLAPLKPLICELQLKVDVRLENPHIVNSDQVSVKVVCKGPDLEILSSSYSNRQNTAYIDSLARTIQNVSRVLPGGLLIFFPSYSVMNLCHNSWQAGESWKAISSFKPIFVEPRDKDEFRQNMKDYYEHINDPKYAGAIFMGVCRGKVAEGLDFADANGRGVIITGLPYAPLMDPKVILKKEYMDQCKKADREYLSGDEWYRLEASRAVNQAIGRVIRHKNDYGIIILADNKFADAKIKANLSKWLQKRIEVVSQFGALIGTTKQFFREAAKNYPVQNLKALESEESQLVEPKADSDSSIENHEKDEDGDLSSSSLEFVSNDLPQTPDTKRRKLDIEPLVLEKTPAKTDHDKVDFMLMLRSTLKYKETIKITNALADYRQKVLLEPLIASIEEAFSENVNNRHIIKYIFPYLHTTHLEKFSEFWENFKSL